MYFFYYLCAKNNAVDNQIQSLYLKYAGQEPMASEAITGSAGERLYCRLTAADGQTVVGVRCDNAQELRAFCELDAAMSAQGIRVPKILAREGNCYLLEDLGPVSLYSFVQECQKTGVWNEPTRQLLHQVMADLADIHFRTLSAFDLSHCCRESVFSATNIRWDLNYFKYCFLKGTGVHIDELQLQKDFDNLERELLKAPNSGFLYHDFQSRNIQVKDGQPYYIDFQGGYKGPFYYDIASFLWQARAGYPDDLRQELLATCLSKLKQYTEVDDREFYYRLDQFVFFRLLQVLGAYGFRGIFERKTAFMTPIPKALKLILSLDVCHEYPYLKQVLEWTASLPQFQEQSPEGPLTVRITSFSYKRGIPEDYSGNGGGFVFDCRAPHNPGRYAEYKQLTGLDQPVIDFLEGRDTNPEHKPFGTELTIPQFLEHVYALVNPAVDTYLVRHFNSLVVNFGCTGGRHRSVYCAEHLARYLKSLHPGLHIVLTHRELGISQEL